MDSEGPKGSVGVCCVSMASEPWAGTELFSTSKYNIFRNFEISGYAGWLEVGWGVMCYCCNTDAHGSARFHILTRFTTNTGERSFNSNKVGPREVLE